LPWALLALGITCPALQRKKSPPYFAPVFNPFLNGVSRRCGPVKRAVIARDDAGILSPLPTAPPP